AVMDPGVAGQAVQGQVAAKFRPIGRSPAPGQIGLAPEYGIDVEARKTGGARLLAKTVQRSSRSFHRAKAVQKHTHIVNGKVRLAVDLPIARMLKIAG